VTIYWRGGKVHFLSTNYQIRPEILMHTENALKENEFNRYNSSLTNYYDSPIGHKKLFFYYDSTVPLM